MDDPPSEPTHVVPAAAFAPPRRRIAFALLTVAVAYAGIGASLLLQPDRWNRAAGYSNLLANASTITWGAIYVGSAMLMACAVWRPAIRPLVVTAHTVGIALTLAWLIGFAIRYLVNSATTPILVIAWAVFLAVLIRSAVVLDDGREPADLTVVRKKP